MTNAVEDIFQDNSKNYLKSSQKKQFLTMRVGNQAFGLPVKKVQDVLRPQKITKIPLARPDILGLINLRGQIVTVIDLKKRLGLGQIEHELTKNSKNRLVVVEYKGALYSLAVDEIGDVLELPLANFEKSPENLSSSWKEISQGVFKLQNILLLVLDTENLLSMK